MATRTDAPGIYFELADPPRRRPEVRSDIAGFAGFAERGPLHHPVRVESWSEFEARFGGTDVSAFLPLAVHAFFANGGRTAFVVRVAVPEDDTAAGEWTLRAARARATFRIGGVLVHVAAASPGRWGNRLEVELVPEPARGTPGPRGRSDVGASLHRFGIRVRQGSSLAASVSGCTLDPAHARFVGRVLAQTPAAGIRLEPGTETALRALPSGELAGLRVRQTARRLRGGRDGLAAVRLAHLIGDPAPDAPEWGLAALARCPEVALLALPDAGAFPRPGERSQPAEPPSCTDLSTPSAAAEAAAGGNPARALDPVRPPTWRLGASSAEVRRHLRDIADEAGLTLDELLAANRPYRTALDAGDDLTLTRLDAPLNLPQPAGEQPPAWSDDDTAAAADALIAVCEQRRDCVALIDAPAGATTVPAAESWRDRFDSPFAALYWPWLETDRLPGRAVPTVRIAMPPSGAVAGLTAAADLRVGPHRAPAGQTVRAAFGARVPLDSIDHARLNERHVNAFRERPGRGVVLEGARSLSVPQGARDPWRYFSVRRVVLVLEQLMAIAAEPLVFEPNGPRLWTDLRDLLVNMLEQRWRRGWLRGDRPADAFFVVCDATTNPPETVDLGLAVALIGLRLPPPIEWIIVRIGRSAGGIEVLDVERA
jgi:uncharacterized protein